MTESPLEYNFEDLFIGQKANFLKKVIHSLKYPIGLSAIGIV